MFCEVFFKNTRPSFYYHFIVVIGISVIKSFLVLWENKSLGETISTSIVIQVLWNFPIQLE